MLAGSPLAACGFSLVRENAGFELVIGDCYLLCPGGHGRQVALIGPRGPAAAVASAGNLAVTVQPGANAEVTSPAAETHTIDYQFWGALLLCIIAWLVYFVGPHMIAKEPSADQAAMADYWSLVPGLALVLTGYIVKSAMDKRK